MAGPAAGLAAAAPLPDPRFIRPVVGLVKIGSGFGPRNVGEANEHFHPGTDIRVPNGTVVQAIGAGEVIRVQKDPHADDGGIHVAVRHANGMISRYLHMMRYDVEVGQRVGQGQPLGLSNNTGLSEGPHLHFELRAPVELLPRVEATVGKPSVGWAHAMSRYGVGLAPESWIPTDEIRATTLANLRRYGIPLYGEWPGSGGRRFSNFTKLGTGPKAALVGASVLAVVGVVGALTWRQRARPHGQTTPGGRLIAT